MLHPLPGDGAARPEVGADLHASVTVSFADAVHGVERQVLVTRQVPLRRVRRCVGRWRLPKRQCRQCQGLGRFAGRAATWCSPSRVRRAAARAGRPASAARSARARGVACAVKRLLSAVPAGITDGGRLRVVEMGHAGRHGGRSGDLYVTVHVQPHPWFRREGDDLVCPLPVAVHEAALGARIDVPSLEGPVKLRMPPGTQARVSACASTAADS